MPLHILSGCLQKWCLIVRKRTEEIRALLKKYGADRLSAIDPANYQALLGDVEELNDAT